MGHQMKLSISYEPHPHHNNVLVLWNGIAEYAKQKKGHKPIESFAFFIRDEKNAIRGGCSGCNLYGCSYIDSLWIDEPLRGKTYGNQLMTAAEKWGKEQGCTFATVNTMDWEALGFYKKLGFNVEFERHGFLKNSIFYFLRKDFHNKNDQDNKFELSPLHENDIDEIVTAFKNIGWNKPKITYTVYLQEQNESLRSIWIAKINQKFCGYVTLKWKADYSFFYINNIPEIVDLNVLPGFRKKGIGTMLLLKCEQAAKDHRHTKIGLGVGMTRDYGDAQRLYIRLGFLPDGNGLHSKCKEVKHSSMVTVDDDLVLYFTKKI